MKLAQVIDLNQNGIPDYQEAFFYRAVWNVTKTLVRTFCPPHTLVRRGVEALDAAMRSGN